MPRSVLPHLGEAGPAVPVEGEAGRGMMWQAV